ncbi:ATP-binding protein [Streptomyces harbinensis]|uniref:Histidine kinase-like ATPase domain-containing protein n=1 Tax=Streptomyces harbinensis TaxID=1176198 RepID=A0A1I6WCA4_9ACTN|nr:ATP-binding protein [Streptomyces harbinensis]SFT23619.1 Histidine kinase-like ATPase domain-containing protein [Streptomyces harbinensis]
MLCPPATLPDNYRMCTWRLDDARQLAALRAAVRTKLTGHVPPAALDDVVTVTGELATNGLVHGDDGVFVAIHARQTRAEIIVRDGGNGLPTGGAPAPAELAEGGRGLAIVEALADAYGHYRRAPGATVWARVTWSSHPTG